MRKIFILILFMAIITFACSPLETNVSTTTEGTDTGLYIISPEAGTTVTLPFTISGIKNEKIASVVIIGGETPIIATIDGEAWNATFNYSDVSEGTINFEVIGKDLLGKNKATVNITLIVTNLSDDPWAAYYSTAYGLTGSELKSALHDIIDNHTVYNYTQVYTALQELDEDPNNPTNVILIYTRRSQHEDYQDHGTDYDYSPWDGTRDDSYNREHCWPKSKGFPNEDQPPYTDLHHMRPADNTVNTARSARDYGDGGTQHTEATQCNYTTDTWEPPDEVKGDLARQMFYMAVRYEGDVTGEPDLELVNYYTSSISDGNGYLGILDVMLIWHTNDPVSDAEKLRNNLIYSNWQHNRNPFVDHPEWVTNIW